MSSHIQTYLKTTQMNKLPNKYNERVKNLSDGVLKDIGNEIVNSRIVIPQEEKQLKFQRNVDNVQVEGITKLNKKYKQIESKKKALLDELTDLQHQENKIKINKSRLQMTMSRVSNPMSNSSLLTTKPKTIKQRSQFTQQQLKKIKQIYKKQKQFKKQLKKRIRHYQQAQKSYKNQVQQQQKQKIKNLCMQKHQQRQKYIKQIQKRNKERQKLLQEQKEKIMELKKKKKLFQQMQEKFLNLKQVQKQKIKEILEENKKKKDLSFGEVKEHERKYDDQKRMKDQQRMQRVRNYKNPNQVKFPCLFLDRIEDQNCKMSVQEEQKREMIKTFVQKKAAYAEEVRKKLHQSRQTMSLQKLSSSKVRIKQIQQPKWLNTPQKYHKGTQYMRQINSKISKLPKKIPQPQNIKLKNSQKFKNYLNDIRNSQILKTKNKQNDISHAYTNMNIQAAKQDINSVNLCKSVKAKLEIMKRLQQNSLC